MLIVNANLIMVVLLILFIQSNALTRLDGVYARVGLRRIFNYMIGGASSSAQRPAALRQYDDADECPENVARFANNRQRHAGGLCVLENRRDLAGARFVNSHAQWNELECQIDHAIHRFEDER